MARLARKELADLRAMEEEDARMELHGSGKHFYGAGATPSMGLSQFRGGAKKKSKCRHVSYEDEGEMEGAGRFQFRLPRLTGPRPTSTAIVPYRPPSGALVPLGPAGRPVARPSMPQSWYQNLGRAPRAPARPVAPASGARTSGLLGRLRSGLTAQRLATAASLGVPLGMLGAYLADAGSSSGTGGYYDDYAGEDYPPSGGPSGPIVDPSLPPAPEVPTDGGDMVDLDGDGIPDTVVPRGHAGTSDMDWLYRSGNVEYAPRRGRGKKAKSGHDGRSARAEIVRKVMREHGLSLPQASKFVKEHGLY